MADTKEFLMPRMGESISEGTIINWLVEEGQAFDEGDILVEVATDKVDNEVPARESGVITKVLYGPQDVVPVGEPIAMYKAQVGNSTSAAEKSVARKPVNTNSDDKSADKKPAQAINYEKRSTSKRKTGSAAFTTSRENVFVSPLIEQIARKHYISYEELARIPGSGMDGRLRKSDLISYLNEGRPHQFAQPMAELQPDPTAYRIPQLKFDKGKGRIVEMDRMRSMIADHMVYSKHTSPHVTAYVEADMTEMVRFRESKKADFQKEHGAKLTFTPLFVQAVAKAIKDFPEINASVDGNNIIIKDEINVGMATALPSGNLIVPVVKNADQKDLPALAKEVNRLAGLARENKLGGDDVKGSTFTISNVGTFGSLMGTPIINQPEAAILATGIIKKRPEVIERNGEDKIEVRQMMYLSLSFDHRIVDGFLGGSFLRTVADYMEDYN